MSLPQDRKNFSRSTIFLLLLFGIIGISIVSAILTSDDIDFVCGLDNHTLFRYNGTWVCGNLDGITINNTYNNITNLIINWSLLEGVPEYLTDGADNDTLYTEADWNSTSLIVNWSHYISGSNLNDTGLILNWSNIIPGAEDTHSHNQDLNTTNAVDFSGLNTTMFTTADTYSAPWNVYSDGDNIRLNFSNVSGNNFVSLETEGGYFQLYSNPNPANDHLLATITETQGADTELNFYEGGTNHNRFWDSGSMRIGGGASRLCANITDFVDCDTPATGADLIVEDDVFAGGMFIGNTTDSWANVSITESQIRDLTHTTDTNTWNTTAEMITAVNTTGFVLNWSTIMNNTGFIRDYNTTSHILNWSSILNSTSTGYIKDWNWTGFIADWGNDLLGTFRLESNYTFPGLVYVNGGIRLGSYGINMNWADIWDGNNADFENINVTVLNFTGTTTRTYYDNGCEQIANTTGWFLSC